MSNREKDINFRSVQFSRHDSKSRKYSISERADGFDVKGRSNTKQRDAKLDVPPDFATVSQMIEFSSRRRPQSYNGSSHKVKRECTVSSKGKVG
jgi:hypothetical protein